MPSPFDATASSDVVTIDLTRHPPNLPLGMLLAPGAGSSQHHHDIASAPTASNVTLVAGWEHEHPTTTRNHRNNGIGGAGSSGGGGGNHGKHHLGPIQRSGLVRLGDRLVRINGRDVTDWTFREVMDALKELVASPSTSSSSAFGGGASNSNSNKRRLKTLGFAPSGTAEWSRGTIHPPANSTISDSFFGLSLFGNSQHSQQSAEDANVIPSGHVAHSKRRYSFVSYIKGWRVAHHHESLSSSREETSISLEQERQRHPENTRQESENSISELERQLNMEPSIRYEGDDPIIPMGVNDDDDDDARRVVSERDDFSNANPNANANVDNTNTNYSDKSFVQYEIQCHILFRNRSSSYFQSHTTHHPHGNGSNSNNNNAIGSNGGGGGNEDNNDDVHHSWSTWKRYTEFATLDEELRRDFGWQMDTLNDGRGIVFPSVRGLESWWYGVRNGGGVVTSMLGGSNGIGIDIDGNDAADVVGGGDVAGNGTGNAEKVREDGAVGWGSSLYGLFATADGRRGAKSETNGALKANTAPNSNHDGNQTSNSNSHGNGNDNAEANKCPFPVAFVEKRQKELSAYWTNLMRVQDIFEFGDVHSHKYGKAMAAFLELDRVLSFSRKTPSLASSATGNRRQGSSSLLPGPKLAFPAINENESTEMFGSFGPSFGLSQQHLTGELSGFTSSMSAAAAGREVSGHTGIHDDDVSLLSDGTGAFGDAAVHNGMNRNGPVPGGRPVVDIVPGRHYSNGSEVTGGSGGGNDGDHGMRTLQSTNEKEEVRRPPSSSLAASSSVASRNNRRRAGPRAAATPRAKPAFQRQFLPP